MARLLPLLLILALLAGCTPAQPTALEAMSRAIRRDVGSRTTIHQATVAGTQIEIFTYKKGGQCGAGVAQLVDATPSWSTSAGACKGDLSPAAWGGDDWLVVYGYLTRPDAARIALRWKDGTQVDATLAKQAFYHLATGRIPAGPVTLVAYDAKGNELQTTPVGGHGHQGH